jgi:hypothetical protein
VTSVCLCTGNDLSSTVTSFRLQLPDAAHLTTEGKLLTSPNKTHYGTHEFDIFILIFLLTAIGLPAGGSATIHNFTQTIVRTTHLTPNWEQCRPCLVFACYTLAFASQLRENMEKPQNNDTQSDNDMLVLLLLCQWSKIKLNPIKVENTFCCACNSICTGEPWTTRLTRIFSICQWVYYSCISRTWSTRCGVWIYVLAWWTGYTPMLLWILSKVQCSP